MEFRSQRDIRVPPAAFARMQVVIMEAELEGYGPLTASHRALSCIGIKSKDYELVTVIVDRNLTGLVYPFMVTK